MCNVLSVGRVMRRTMLAVALLLTGSVKAEWLFWTVDFNDSWDNPGTLQANPAAGRSETFSVWLVAKEVETGTRNYLTPEPGFELHDDAIGGITQANLEAFGDMSGYVFYVEMGFAGETGHSVQYESGRWLYTDLVSIGCVANDIEAIDAPLNGAVGASPWFAVPEPTSGLLSLFGLAALLLRRKRCVCGRVMT